MANRFVHPSGLAWRVALVLGVLAVAGCCRWNWRGPGFGDNEGNWARKMRPPADDAHLSGLDTRAQEIERDLGVR